ncbi:MAG: mechanosensitive ion channel family protein [Patescibacteria group bacterium]
MNFLAIWQQALIVAWNSISTSFLSFLPTFVGALVVFIIGLLISSWARRIIEGILKLVQFQEVTEKIGAEAFLKKAEIKLSSTEIIGAFVKWFVILVFFIAAVDILGLTTVSVMLTRLLSYIPNVLAAALIFAVGYFIANLVDGIIRGILATVDHEAARLVGRLARWVILLIAFFTAVSELRIAQGLVETFFTGLTWTIVLAVGLSIGFGAKDLVAKILEDWYDKLKK